MKKVKNMDDRALTTMMAEERRSSSGPCWDR